MAVGGYQAKDSVDDPDATRIVLRADPPSGLPRGTRLRDFEIESVVGEGRSRSEPASSRCAEGIHAGHAGAARRKPVGPTAHR
jgi:hypothetical protein